ncbi:hypothetical protein MKW98_013115 [Papaver atlanticum]|uniref:Uncharacterized protein n=1 Tax=Papaver atlanticum TaxID=357466 RepID=A0AAD4T8H8_9MAGN|nr:hypothetical protein MKW98_013115 [Papaver atlanticum]
MRQQFYFDWLTSRIAFELMKQGAIMTVLSTLLAALAWPTTLLTATDFIDSKWSIAVDSFALNQVLHPRAKAAISVWICGFDEDFEAELAESSDARIKVLFLAKSLGPELTEVSQVSYIYHNCLELYARMKILLKVSFVHLITHVP